MILNTAPDEVRTKQRTSRWGCRSRLQRLQVAIMLGNFVGVMRYAMKMKHKLAGWGVNLQQETQFLCACWTYGILAMQQTMSLKQPLRKVTYGITCVPPPVTRWTYIAATQTKSGHRWPCHVLFFSPQDPTWINENTLSYFPSANRNRKCGRILPRARYSLRLILIYHGWLLRPWFNDGSKMISFCSTPFSVILGPPRLIKID